MIQLPGPEVVPVVVQLAPRRLAVTTAATLRAARVRGWPVVDYLQWISAGYRLQVLLAAMADKPTPPRNLVAVDAVLPLLREALPAPAYQIARRVIRAHCTFNPAVYHGQIPQAGEAGDPAAAEAALQPATA